MKASLLEIIDSYNPEAPLEEALTIPAPWYTDQTLYNLELQTVFANSWHLAARVDQLCEPGQYVTSDIAGEPVVVVRGSDGVLRGFFNACRHHAAAVMTEPQGRANQLRCPYHGWTRDAGFPDGVFEVVTSRRAEPIAEVLTSSLDVRKISFTGSTRVGKLLMKQCSDTLKKVSLELGGNAPYIVFEDADLDAAAEGAIMAKFRNAGQTCVSANRILVHQSAMERFARKMAQSVAALSVGDGFAAETTVGPLINRSAFKKVDKLVQSAVRSGARLVRGGTAHPAGANFYNPTILSDVRPDMEIAQSEIFGPVATLFPFETDDEAVAIANDTRSGLAAYFWTKDLTRAWRVAEALEYGMVGINEWIISSEAAPFGGIKESGIGREGSRYGIDDYVELKYVAMGGL